MEFYKNILRKVSLLFVFLVFIQVSIAASNVIDVKISETAFDSVLYNPLKASSGLFVDANENRSIYNLSGEIIISNNHLTEPVENIVLNISGISNIYDVLNYSGAKSYVSEFNSASDYMIIVVPDLGAGQNAVLRYKINTSNVAPPLNFTSNYSGSKLFAGLSLGVTDKIENILNASAHPNNCIYNINITQNALSVNQSGLILNFTYDSTSMTGSDSGNASFSSDNRTIFWNTLNSNCLYSGNTTDISYLVNTPSGVNLAKNYQFINSTIKYNINTTISEMNIVSINGVSNLDLKFQKYLNKTLNGDNATWKITSNVSSPSDITVNLTKVTLWVSVRNATGTGFTNPSQHDNDTVSGAELLKIYNPNILLNNSLPAWSNPSSEWYFNYTFSSSPIVWMDMENKILNDGVQITNKSIVYGNNSIYIKEIYLVTGYWLQIDKNITRLDNNTYNVKIRVINLGNSPTPFGQVVQIYNFLPNTFNLISGFVFSNSPWYNTTNTSELLNDPIYNGTMYQFALIPNGNPSDSSLDAYGGASNENNTWVAEFNVSGSGEFKFDDLFLTGVDPLHVDSYGSTKALSIEGAIGFVSDKLGIALGVAAVIMGALALLL